jgi:hypothetical protein
LPQRGFQHRKVFWFFFSKKNMLDVGIRAARAAE